MKPVDQSICLNMIVKNESKIIKRCLASVKSLISHWVIVDTGSTDDTQEIIKDYFQDIPGELHERPWLNFSHNRNEALALAKGKADYILVIDADEVLALGPGFRWPALKAGGYKLETRFGNISYMRLQLIKATLPWKWEGVLHEYLTTPFAIPFPIIPNIWNYPHTDGARASNPQKFEEDAALLESALKDDPNNPRYVYYLAQSYRDAREYEKAIKNYEKRIQMGGWEEETWSAQYEIAKILHFQQVQWEAVQTAYLKAFEMRPSRAEPLFQLARHFRQNGNYELAYLYAKRGAEIPMSKDHLFVETAVYLYMLKMEKAILAYWVGNDAEAIRINNELLKIKDIPTTVFDQVLANQKFSLDRAFPRNASAPKVQNKIKVFIPFYNPGPFLEKAVVSLLAQDYAHFEMIFIDDASTDGAHKMVPTEDSRVTLIRNPHNRGGARNLHSCLTEYCDPEDIYVQLDGDDWLEGPDVLSYINQFYNETDCWVMYGQFRYVTGTPGCAAPFADADDFRNLRNTWKCPAIRTFRAGLYHRIAEQDPDFSCMKDEEGNWFQEAMDVALIYPVFELAGFDKVRFNDRVLYVYNNENPLNVHKERRPKEANNHRQICQKRPFSRVGSYIPGD